MFRSYPWARHGDSADLHTLARAIRSAVIVPAGSPPATEPLWSGVASSGNRSRKLPCLRKKDGVARGIAQYGRRRLSKGQDAGGPLETAGSAGDLEGQSTLGLIRREIDAIASVREIDLQQAPVKEAKQTGAGYILKIDLGRARASGGLLCSGARLNQSKRERALRAAPGEILFRGIGVGVL